ncbi:MAG: hypothetical protein IKO74_11835 [Selenomonadaceae bacterium]|nr:hypothetical protein [Selenomonadaceae bacterium]
MLPLVIVPTLYSSPVREKYKTRIFLSEEVSTGAFSTDFFSGSAGVLSSPPQPLNRNEELGTRGCW